MEIDIRALETYSELAREGAESAADALSALTGIETRVDVTGVSLLSRSDLRYEFAGQEFAGVSVSLGDPLSGETVLAFDERGREAITQTLVPTEDPDRVESAIVEVGNIVVNGFVSGWADHLETKVETAPPTYVSGTGLDVLPSTVDTDGHFFVFRSRVTAAADAVEFRILLVPELESLHRLLEQREGAGISLEKLEVFTEMTEQGAARAADNIGLLTGFDADVEVNRLHFASVADIQGRVSDERAVGAVVEYEGTPGGYLAMLFDPASARTTASALIPEADDGAEADDGTEADDSVGTIGDTARWSERERGALEELCNLIASGFVDGWANVLQTSIAHSPPTFVADMGSSIVSPIVASVARTKNYAFVLDSTVQTVDDERVQCDLFAVPHPEELEAALDALLVERVDETRADPDDLF